MSEELFFHPDVVRVVRAVLVERGVRHEQDLEDGIGNVVQTCIEYVRETKRPPADVKEACTISRGVANLSGKSAVRKTTTRGKTNVGLTDAADEHHADAIESELDPVDVKRALEVAQDELARAGGSVTLETFGDIAAKTKQKKLAEEHGVSHAAMRKRVEKARKTIVQRMAAGDMRVLLPPAALALLAVLGFFWIRNGMLNQEAQNTPVPTPSAVPSQVPVVVHPTMDEREAAGYRKEAKALCDIGSWTECRDKLDSAKVRDPKGEELPEVKAERAAIEQGVKDWSDDIQNLRAKPRQ
ncbi:MAG: hypothetical protein ACRELB_05045 [Polyangiaceae bacterium]